MYPVNSTSTIIDPAIIEIYGNSFVETCTPSIDNKKVHVTALPF